jgi:hypothetical protein
MVVMIFHVERESDRSLGRGMRSADAWPHLLARILGEQKRIHLQDMFIAR